MRNLRLSNYRKKNNFTQEQIAKLIGLSTKSYNRKELGLIEFNREEISRLSEVLNLTLDDLNEIFFSNKITKGQLSV